MDLEADAGRQHSVQEHEEWLQQARAMADTAMEVTAMDVTVCGYEEKLQVRRAGQGGAGVGGVVGFAVLVF